MAIRRESGRDGASGLYDRDDGTGVTLGAQELLLYVDNDGDLYRQMTTPILRNLALKKAKKTYDRQKALKAFLNLAKAGADKYCREFGGEGCRTFSKKDRDDFAEVQRRSFEGEYKLGNYEGLLPAKYQKPATRKAASAALAAADADRSHSIGDPKKRQKHGLSPKLVRPHKSARECPSCGVIHSKRVHDAGHSRAPRGGRVGRYRKTRG